MTACIKVGGVQQFDCRGDVINVSAPKWKGWIEKSIQGLPSSLYWYGCIQEIFKTLPTLEVENEIN